MYVDRNLNSLAGTEPPCLIQMVCKCHTLIKQQTCLTDIEFTGIHVQTVVHAYMHVAVKTKLNVRAWFTYASASCSYDEGHRSAWCHEQANAGGANWCPPYK